MLRRQLLYGPSCDQSSTPEPRQVQQQSEPVCALCKVSHSHVSRVSTWQSTLACSTASQYGITQNDMVCRPCRDDIRRVAANPSGYTPRWEKSKHKEKCCIRECANSSFTHTKTNKETITTVLSELDLQCERVEIPFPTPLCSKHYYAIYQKLHQPQQTNCPTCNISLKHSNPRPCPNAKAIEEHFRTVAGFDIAISSTDKVCYSCYKSHLIILQEQQQQGADLQTIVSKYRQKAAAPQAVLSTTEQVRELAMDKTIVHVGEQLLEGNAMLLPEAYEFFLEKREEILTASHLVESETKTVTARWVLSNLTVALQQHLVYANKVCKYGTVLYCRDTDLVSVLQKSLSKIRQYEKKFLDLKTSQDPSGIHSSANCSMGEGTSQPKANTSMDTVLNDLNALVLDQCKSYLDRDKEFREEYTSLNVEKQIEQMNPTLKRAVYMLTKSQFEKDEEPKKKQLRRYFLLCSMLFCTDDRCSMPMHVLIADLVESQGGTAFLVQVLNKLGICSSLETLKRFIQSKVGTQLEKHPCHAFFNSDSFTVVSVDNLDFLHSYARVHKGTSNSSWHGTTVQVAQPVPSIAPVQRQGYINQSVRCTVEELASTSQASNTCTEGIAANMEQTQSEVIAVDMEQTQSEVITVDMEQTQSEVIAVDMEQTQSGVIAVDMEQTQSLLGATLPVPDELTSDTETCATSVASLTEQTSELTLEQSRKRPERSSPIPSPLKLTRSPSAKLHCRARTATEFGKGNSQKQTVTVPLLQIHHSQQVRSISEFKIDDFLLNEMENESIQDLHYELFVYMLSKFAIANSNSEYPFIDIQGYFNITRATHTEKSKVAYLEVIDAIADSKDTQLQLLQDLFTKFIQHKERDYLIIEGDQKLYEVLQALKFEYGNELDWAIPFPGDWHMLKNYQIALMKPYYDAGLKDLAKAAGYPTASIQACGQFKRTHHFLLEAWEAIYRVVISRFFDQCSNDKILEFIHEHIMANFNSRTMKEVENEIKSLGLFEEFKIFIQGLARVDHTWRFWVQFLFQDLNAYIGLFLSIRSADWNLRTASIKHMAPLFTVFDHLNYRKLIAIHLADLLTMPKSMLTMLQQGGFVISISGNPWHSVGIDEAHEMLINKSCKMAVVRPSPDHINTVAHYLPYRTKAIESLSSYLFPEEKKQSHASPVSKNTKREENVKSQIEVINSSGMLDYVCTDRGLLNPFNKKQANSQQSLDLLTFRDVGQQEFLNHITFTILKQPSTSAVVRKRRLQTFSSKKHTKRCISQLQKDRQLILSCMRKKIRWSHRTGNPIDRPGEQLIALPLALCDHSGNPNKGQKSNMTKVLVNRYTNIVVNNFPQGWQPECCLLEGMFMINSSPAAGQITFGDYGHFLMRRHVIPYLFKGSRELHLLFDNPGQLQNTPKVFEQKRRDGSVTTEIGHTCQDIMESTKLPAKWRENVLNCRKCKRALTCFLSSFMLKHISVHLSPCQTFYVAGSFAEVDLVNTCWFVTGSMNTPQPDPTYTCNAEETDTMIWLHADRTRCSRILILSPDTDVYMIGLPMKCTQDKEVFVQISDMKSRELKLMHIKCLIDALANDLDIASIPATAQPTIIQTLFVSTGCDYVSFFSGIGKATFFKCFFQHAEFITGYTQYTKGSLTETSMENDMHKNGFLAFLRLIGTVYFKRHVIAFDYDTPESHYKSFLNPGMNVTEHHRKWLEDIRQCTWDRITIENEMVPSVEALWRHWLRSCWVIHIWKQGDSNTMHVTDVCECGWTISIDGTLSIEWDSEENLSAVAERVGLLTRGCRCKTGCSTGRCGCRKKGKHCSEGCECLNCVNLPKSIATEQDDTVEQENEENTELSETELQTYLDYSFSDSDSDIDIISD